MGIFSDHVANMAINETFFDAPHMKEDFKNGDPVIVVLEGGWVFAGIMTKLDDKRIRLDSCYNVHRWGTTRGLGELALNGPMKDTVLNECESIICAPIFLLALSDKWK